MCAMSSFLMAFDYSMFGFWPLWLALQLSAENFMGHFYACLGLRLWLSLEFAWLLHEPIIFKELFCLHLFTYFCLSTSLLEIFLETTNSYFSLLWLHKHLLSEMTSWCFIKSELLFDLNYEQLIFLTSWEIKVLSYPDH